MVLNELIPKSLKIQLLKSIKDSIASEHGARMTAMHKATDNATELRDQLKLSYYSLLIYYQVLNRDVHNRVYVNV